MQVCKDCSRDTRLLFVLPSTEWKTNCSRWMPFDGSPSVNNSIGFCGEPMKLGTRICLSCCLVKCFVCGWCVLDSSCVALFLYWLIRDLYFIKSGFSTAFFTDLGAWSYSKVTDIVQLSLLDCSKQPQLSWQHMHSQCWIWKCLTFFNLWTNAFISLSMFTRLV